ncbi:peptidylprolyl isomerase [Aliiroseovarius sp. PrR006]|uniref:peptidylprolyl isomerase n=1 Tax=Aliiroseovarius sp. PrR006 TaxID=2706883 RepID=UPI0013D23E9A|nr:peptidylprolyl isomerase [Aliiroseovarius sp. PrR006]NDW52044.1 peptidylprolyl isomerase [Aliiroseovarius sp. PrR006]
MGFLSQSKAHQTQRKATASAWTCAASGLVFGLVSLAGLDPAPAQAQNLFAPVAKINDSVITSYQLSQRMAFLTVLRAPGNLRELALQQLTDEALQRQAADAAGVSVTAEEVLAGMSEFTGRFNLKVEDFNKIIAQADVAPETFRDFVANGLAWRAFVRKRWQGRISVTDNEIDRQLSLTAPGQNVRVLLSEIVLPAENPEAMQDANARAAQLSEITTLGAFATEARRSSVSQSSGRSGRLNWTDLSDLPPPVAAQVVALEPGHVTDPVPVQNGVAVFQLRAIEEVDRPTPSDVNVDYAALMIPGGRSAEALTKAAEIHAATDSCNDLFGMFPGSTEAQIQRETVPVGELPTRYAVELAQLDMGEASTALTSADGQNLVYLMLCSRSRELPEDVSREQLKLRLQNQRLQAFSTAYLEELRAAAFIEEFDAQ